jgi:transcriptional regulator with XRE-family HTH domain
VAKKFEQLRSPLRADPERRARIEEYKRATYDALALAELREAKHMTQQQVAQSLGVSQANISRIEHEDDVYLSTLSSYVEALGGRLELTAVFPDGSVTLLEPESERE